MHLCNTALLIKSSQRFYHCIADKGFAHMPAVFHDARDNNCQMQNGSAHGHVFAIVEFKQTRSFYHLINCHESIFFISFLLIGFVMLLHLGYPLHH